MSTSPGLLGDVGGTHARFALLTGGTGAGLRDELTFPSADFPDLASAMEAYLRATGAAPRRAVVAVATPVLGDAVQFTNLPWRFSTEATRRRLGLDSLRLVNDFAALALGLPGLAEHERRQVGGGAPEAGRPLALLGAGTGLGVSGLVPHPGGWSVIEGEGGHVSFAPADDREAALLQWLRGRHGHVSAERLASGPGLSAILQGLRTLDGVDAPVTAPEAVTEGARRGEARCAEAVEIFCRVLGTVASDLCLTLGARGGVYLAGGIVPALGEGFDRSGFRARFEDKGRFRGYLSAVPAYVVTARNPALRGAAVLLGGPAMAGSGAGHPG